MHSNLRNSLFERLSQCRISLNPDLQESSLSSWELWGKRLSNRRFHGTGFLRSPGCRVCHRDHALTWSLFLEPVSQADASTGAKPGLAQLRAGQGRVSDKPSGLSVRSKFRRVILSQNAGFLDRLDWSRPDVNSKPASHTSRRGSVVYLYHD